MFGGGERRGLSLEVMRYHADTKYDSHYTSLIITSLSRLVSQIGEWKMDSGLKIFNSSLITSQDSGRNNFRTQCLYSEPPLARRAPPDGGDEGGAPLRDDQVW